MCLHIVQRHQKSHPGEDAAPPPGLLQAGRGPRARRNTAIASEVVVAIALAAVFPVLLVVVGVRRNRWKGGSLEHYMPLGRLAGRCLEPL